MNVKQDGLAVCVQEGKRIGPGPLDQQNKERKGEKENITDKIKHIPPARFQGVKPVCLDFKEVPTQT